MQKLIVSKIVLKASLKTQPFQQHWSSWKKYFQLAKFSSTKYDTKSKKQNWIVLVKTASTVMKKKIFR